MKQLNDIIGFCPISKTRRRLWVELAYAQPLAERLGARVYIQHYRGMVLLTVCNAGTVVGGGLVEALPKSTIGVFNVARTVKLHC